VPAWLQNDAAEEGFARSVEGMSPTWKRERTAGRRWQSRSDCFGNRWYDDRRWSSSGARSNYSGRQHCL